MVYRQSNTLRLRQERYNLHMYNFRLILAVLALGTIGVLVIHSAADGYAQKQMYGFAGGLIMMFIISRIDYNKILKFAWPLYAFNILMLAAVRLMGTTVNGATRWFGIGGFRFQPSELSKVLMIIIFSYYINDQKDRINHLPTLVKIGMIYAIPLMLIVIQPDLSTTLVFIFLFCVLMFVAGLSYKIIGGVLLLAIPSIVFLFWYIQQPFQKLLKDYQVDRVMSFLHPSDYLLTTYYQQYNSIMAIGSGMLTGKGLDNNTITSVKGGDFISEPQTDFIFAVVGEELGFIGCCVVIGLLAFIVVECLIIAANARDLCGKLLASGVAAVISFQTFINIGVATGIIANTGIPLPFVSYGLSSLWSNFIGLGLILNIGLQRNRR